MRGHGSRLSRKQEVAIVALMTEKTLEDAAMVIGIGVATLRRWQKDPEFADALQKAKRQHVEQTLGRFARLAGPALSTLTKVMVDPSSPAAARVTAANIVLNQTIKIHSIEDLVARVAEIERLYEQNRTDESEKG